MKTKRKRQMTLLEVLIALSILSVLLVIVFGFFYELTKIDQLTRFEQTQTFHRRYGEYRLSYLFSHIVNELDNHKKLVFLMENSQATSDFTNFPSLVFNYNNGVRLNPAFSGDVLARLYVDQDKQLCLASWPISLPNPHLEMQKEVLFDNVESIQFAFFKAPDRKQTSTSQQDGSSEIVDQGVWPDEWPQKMKKLPVLVKIQLWLRREANPIEKGSEKDKLDELTLIFHLPTQSKNQNAIFYPIQS